MRVPGMSRGPEGTRKISGRHADRSQFAIQLGGDESRPEDLGFALLRSGLHIQCQKSMKDVVSEERDEQEAFDGAGVMFENVIGAIR